MNDGTADTAAAQLRALAYPLNVYARAIELEEGLVQDLHYGLHETAHVPIALAQRRFAELLWKHLPPPCRLLDVGVGSGAMLARLVAAGYAAKGITPDPAQAAFARARHGGALPAACAGLEDFAQDPGGWDALLFRDSAQHIDPLDLFSHAAVLLAEHGEIILADEFALRRAGPGPERLHLLDHFLALAGRFGFAVVDRFDLSREAAPTLDYRLRVISRHADSLQRDLDVTAQALETLSAANATHREQYADGRCGYLLLRLRRIAIPRWRLGRIHDANGADMRTLFEEIFRHPMSEAHWRWKYGEGRGSAVGVWEGERLIAHYGGVVKDIMFFGRPQSASQICDVVVALSGRGTLSRQGPLFLTISTFLENQLGYGNPHLLGVGFPNLRHWKVAERLELYGGPVGRMLELSWPAMRGRPSPILAVRPLDLARARDRSAADACWRAMRADLNDMIVGVRDAGALDHRYRAHPDKAYLVFVVRRRLSGRPLGLFVLRPDAEGGCELLDAVAPLAAMPKIIAQARRAAAGLGARRLYCWAVDNIRAHFGTDAQARDLEVIVPANAWTAGPPIETLVGRWWLTGGDTDFR